MEITLQRRPGLRERSHVEGQNIAVAWRFAEEKLAYE
jgi:hypothetical protein